MAGSRLDRKVQTLVDTLDRFQRRCGVGCSWAVCVFRYLPQRLVGLLLQVGESLPFVVD